MSSTLRASVFMVKNDSGNWHSIKNTKDLTVKQMFDISEKLIVGQSDEIYGMSTINLELLFMELFILVGDEQVISLLHTKGLRILRFCVYALGKVNEDPQVKHCMGRQIEVVQKFTRIQSIQSLGQTLMVSQWNSSGISSQDSPHCSSPHCSSATKSKSYMSRLSVDTSKIHWTDYLHVDVQRHLMGI